MWTQAINVLLGIWLVVAPDALDFGDPARAVDRVVGPVAIFFAALALRDVTRPIRWANVVTGAVLLIAPWIVGYRPITATVNSLIVGMLLIVFAALGGHVHQRTGGGWSALIRSQTRRASATPAVLARHLLPCYNARMPCRVLGGNTLTIQEGEREMGLFGAKRRVPAGRHFGRELEHHEHTGWRKLVLVRHGQTDYNVKHLLPGQLPGIPLNDEGRREAQATAAALRELPLTAIVASPLERTMETAGYLNAGRGLAIRQDRDLLDTGYGRYSGQCWDDLDKQDRAWQRFTTDPLHAPKGVESFASVQKRAVRAAERWRHAEDAGGWAALVTHADLVKLIVAHYLGVPLVSVPLINMDNAAASLLAFHPDPTEPPTLLCFNWTSPALWLSAAQHT